MAMVEMTKRFSFDAAHHLPRLPKTHKCYRMHGHTYSVDLTLTAKIDPQTGFAGGVDFDDLAGIFEREIMCRFDHRVLNDDPEIQNLATCERLSVVIFGIVQPHVQQLSSVTVWESSTTHCTYRGQK